MSKTCRTIFINALLLLFFIHPHCYSQTKLPQTTDTTGKAMRKDTSTFESFKLKHGRRIKYIDKYTDLKVFYEKTIGNDSMAFMTKGTFISFKKDTILIEGEEFQEYNRITDNNYKSRSIWPTEKTKIAVKDITKIHRSRDGLLASMVVCGFGALVSGLIVSPLISIEKNGFNKERFKMVTGISLSTIPLWITIAVSFEWHKCQIQPTKKKKKLWTIEKETG